ncbi:MAG TPA: hypothetical protein VN372_11205 [Methanospirillum sp.]|nr:hypothetical protein [Methanospirillum sp.]
MEYRIVGTALVGGGLTLASWLFIDQALAGITLILTFTLLLALAISADAERHRHPQMYARLSDDAQTIVVENVGNAPATEVSVRVIPDDITYKIGTLEADQSHQHIMTGMIREAKARISWKRTDGTLAEKIFTLSGYHQDEDPLRPMMPLFAWKGK